ncbi:hypothetical protein RH08_04390 [Candidatus Liberibacter asiaticus]|uniref:Uncharacterized protein n=2 Tax=Liberibacter asiaticus TaxID=34021 RepID=C6XGG0_LIBAP|nr:hypothetical protein CLIBASIA_04455 [Candidatus Liberibacter asiaticus str. psy62]AGH17229.1 hypothetical protein WSI_04295 [Candidatus Liberibacter asiaticus str. gxpsy]ALK07526.1 hypothetical protein CD16_04365 [Candidatus Liberibacter asiaticus]BAP26759.1 hypothetical protein CGUJ_04455 [Candidatus Liberibacter asiaticus str. Ishi-1]ASK53017.1 hypothetical protein B2I23_04430 [Candidatus Liberibacter asiaticus]
MFLVPDDGIDDLFEEDLFQYDANKSELVLISSLWSIDFFEINCALLRRRHPINKYEKTDNFFALYT